MAPLGTAAEAFVETLRRALPVELERDSV